MTKIRQTKTGNNVNNNYYHPTPYRNGDDGGGGGSRQRKSRTNSVNFILCTSFIVISMLPLISSGADAVNELSLRKRFIHTSANPYYSNGIDGLENEKWKAEIGYEHHPSTIDDDDLYHSSKRPHTEKSSDETNRLHHRTEKNHRHQNRRHHNSRKSYGQNIAIDQSKLNDLSSKQESIYEKKYFDYLPADGMDLGVSDIDLNLLPEPIPDIVIEKMDPAEKAAEQLKNHNGHRHRRDVAADSDRKIIKKRQAYWTNSQATLRYRPLAILNSRQSVPYVDIGNNEIYHSKGTKNDPWNNRFNGYHYPRPLKPFNYPSPAVYTNVGEPPQNPSGSSIGERFGEDEGVVFPDSVGTNTPRTTTVTPSLFHNSDDEVPPPRPNGPNTNDRSTTGVEATPPLLHNSDGEAAPPRPTNLRTTSRPSFSQSSSGNRIPLDFFGGVPVWGYQPKESAQLSPTNDKRTSSESQIPQRTTRPKWSPTTTPRVSQQDQGCIWAVLNCCRPSKRTVVYDCFEQHGCGGFFFGRDACSDTTLDLAIATADQFYNE